MLQKNLRLKKKQNSLIKALALFVIFTGIANAQLFKDPLLLKGLEKGYNFHFEEAGEIFDSYTESNSNSLKGQFLKTKLKLWKFVGSRSNEAFTDFSNSNEILINELDQKLDDDPDNIALNYMIASSYTSKTIALSTNYQIVDAFWAAKKAMSYLEDLIDDHPDVVEPYLEQGILTYALSYVEGVATVALTLSGMDADKEKGLELLLKASTGNLYCKVEASFYLSQVLSEYIADYQGAIDYLLPVSEKFPDNILFAFQLAVLHTKNNELEMAGILLDKIISGDKEVFPQTRAFSNFLKGDLLLKKGDYAESAKYFEEFLAKSNDVNFSSKAYYNIALCHMFLGNKYAVQKNLASTNLGNLENGDDKFARRRSQLLQNSGYNSDIIKLLRVEIILTCSLFDKAENVLTTINYNNLSGDFKSVYNIFKAEILLGKGKFPEFYKLAALVLNTDIEEESWVIAKANLLIAEMYFEQKNYAKCDEFLDEAEDENEYDFVAVISGRINKTRLALKNRNYR
ncbi:MAG: tetratricopeptide repeat protein [Rhodothermaceae bacterium]